MGMRDRKNRREERSGRSMTDRRRKEHKSGGGGGSYPFTPPNLPQWKPEKEGEYRLDFVPSIAGKNNPFAEKGERCFEMTYHVHTNIGPDNGKVLCNLKMFKKPCFVCEYRAKKYGSIPVSERTKESKAAFGRLLPKERQLFLLRNADKPKKGLHWFEYSNYAFGQYLDKKIDNAKSDKDKKIRHNFAEVKGGSTLVISGTEKPAGDGTFIEMSDIQFEPRSEPLPKDLVKQAESICLDECFKPEDYKKVKQLFLGASGDDEESEDEEDDEKDWEEGDEDEDSDDDDDSDDGDDDDDSDDGDDDEDSEDDDDEDSEDDDEDDDKEDSDDDDDDEEDDDDEDEDDEDDDEEDSISVGDRVKFTKNDKTYKGKVVTLNKKNGLANVKVKGKDKPMAVKIAKLKPLGDSGEPRR